jgi:SAM-dependent methyltransferase
LAIDRLRDLVRPVAERLLRRYRPLAAIPTHPFDVRYGTDTSGLLWRRSLRTGQACEVYVTGYFGVAPSRFERAIDRWRDTLGTVAPEQYRFIDIGCGKGRALMLASRMPFRDVVGIELNAGLAATARENLVRWRALAEPKVAVSVLHADATSAVGDLLDGPTLLFLYNPFKAPALRQLLRTVAARRGTAAAPVDLLYVYTTLENVFGEFPQYQRVWHDQIPLDPEDAGDGVSGPTDPCSLYRCSP